MPYAEQEGWKRQVDGSNGDSRRRYSTINEYGNRHMKIPCVPPPLTGNTGWGVQAPFGGESIPERAARRSVRHRAAGTVEGRCGGSIFSQQSVQLLLDFPGRRTQYGVPCNQDDPEALISAPAGRLRARIRKKSRSHASDTVRTAQGPQAPGFAQQSFRAVPANCAANLAAGHDGAGGVVRLQQVNYEQASDLLDAVLVDLLEIGSIIQRPPLATVSIRHCIYAEMRLRPLARLRLSTRRPALVDMRLRKPWRRARFKLLGWNVRFTDLSFVHLVLVSAAIP